VRDRATGGKVTDAQRIRELDDGLVRAVGALPDASGPDTSPPTEAGGGAVALPGEVDGAVPDGTDAPMRDDAVGTG